MAPTPISRLKEKYTLVANRSTSIFIPAIGQLPRLPVVGYTIATLWTKKDSGTPLGLVLLRKCN